MHRADYRLFRVHAQRRRRQNGVKKRTILPCVLEARKAGLSQMNTEPDDHGGSPPSCQLCDGSGWRRNGVTGRREPCPLCGKPHVFKPGPIPEPDRPKPSSPLKVWPLKKYPEYEPKICGNKARCEDCGGIHPHLNACPTTPWKTAEWILERKKWDAWTAERHAERLAGKLNRPVRRRRKSFPNAFPKRREGPYDTDEFRTDELEHFGPRPRLL